jgi:N-acetylneuraminic acid mutarotase
VLLFRVNLSPDGNRKKGTAMFRSRAIVALMTMTLAGSVGAKPCRAHFPWLATDAEGHALLFFGESPEDRTYRLPEAVAKAKVTVAEAGAEAKEVELAAIETDEFVGRKSDSAVPKGGLLESTISYGIYHGMLLDYYAKHLPSAAGPAVASGLKLDAIPKVVDGKVEVAVTWEGKPVQGASVTMTDAEGVPTEESTNAAGVAKFDAPSEGLIGFLVARTDENAKGEVEGEKYTSAAAYGTVTVQFGDATVASAPSAEATTTSEAETVNDAAANNAGLAPLPEALSSFGGAVCDGYLYTYSGHIGIEHAHSRDNLSNHFRRLKLEEGSTWEELPMQLPLQGLPLIAHGGKLYRPGGLSFRNAAEDEPDMHSVAEFACFDPKTSKWTALAPLPEPRSSHDAVVLGDTLYVVGGWTLSGEKEGEWLSTAWSFDLTKPEGEWKAVASPTFKRRALAVARWDRQLVAIGGMDDNGKPSRRVDAFDPLAGTWTKLPDLPRSQMAGFGVSAWNLDGQMLVSGADGVVHKLADDGSKWEQVGKLATGRFFHRLLPGADSTLLAVAGASVDAGHLPTIESFKPGKPASN